MTQRDPASRQYRQPSLNVSSPAPATILVGGDLYPGQRYAPLFSSSDVHTVFGDLFSEFKTADYVIANLEGPLIIGPTPIQKTGPTLGAPTSCIVGLDAAGIKLLNLGNNHIFDHGQTGLETTLDLCHEHGISTVGAGRNVHDASSIFIATVKGLTLGILSVSEHEFSIATDNSWGAAPLDLVANSRTLARYRDAVDFLLVLFHGGNEHYPYPSPRLREQCRFFAEMGADAVVVQHTHRVGCYEKYGSSHIVYGQGNLIFDLPRQSTHFHEGLLLKFTIRRKPPRNCSGDHISLTTLPFFQGGGRLGVSPMNEAEKTEFLSGFEERSRNVQNDEFIKNSWRSFCLKRKHEYLSYLLGHNRFVRYFNSRGFFGDKLYSRRLFTYIRNIVLCESHRDVIEELLRDASSKNSFQNESGG